MARDSGAGISGGGGSAGAKRWGGGAEALVVPVLLAFASLGLDLPSAMAARTSEDRFEMTWLRI
jgi:hypothetical protein